LIKQAKIKIFKIKETLSFQCSILKM